MSAGLEAIGQMDTDDSDRDSFHGRNLRSLYILRDDPPSYAASVAFNLLALLDALEGFASAKCPVNLVHLQPVNTAKPGEAHLPHSYQHLWRRLNRRTPFGVRPAVMKRSPLHL